MSFDSLESSVESSEPIELYKFLLGTDTYTWCSTEDEITIGSDTYVPASISRDNTVIGREDRSSILTVEVPASNSLAQRYIGTPPGSRASLSIFRVQRQEGGSPLATALIYKGSILSVQFPQDQDVARIILQSIEAAISRNIPRISYMLPCNHILYDERCGVAQASYQHTGAVSSISGDTVTVTGAGASGHDFTGGYAKPTSFTDFRLVLAHSGDVITLLLPFEQDPTGGNVDIFAGCDHLLDGDCSQTFANEENFGGFPFVPTDNLFQKGLKA